MTVILTRIVAGAFTARRDGAIERGGRGGCLWKLEELRLRARQVELRRNGRIDEECSRNGFWHISIQQLSLSSQEHDHAVLTDSFLLPVAPGNLVNQG